VAEYLAIMAELEFLLEEGLYVILNETLTLTQLVSDTLHYLFVVVGLSIVAELSLAQLPKCVDLSLKYVIRCGKYMSKSISLGLGTKSKSTILSTHSVLRNQINGRWLP
jgi:hypothetical protein